jgi:signal transduction histidine kinase
MGLSGRTRIAGLSICAKSTSVLGHELRNPLAPIAHGARVLRRLMPHDSEVVRICDMFERQLDTMRRLLDDLLDVSGLN